MIRGLSDPVVVPEGPNGCASQGIGLLLAMALTLTAVGAWAPDPRIEGLCVVLLGVCGLVPAWCMRHTRRPPWLCWMDGVYGGLAFFAGFGWIGVVVGECPI